MQELITPLQQKTLELLADDSYLKDHVYWSGGTALAVVYLQHRKSYDLDFFSGQPISAEKISGFIETLRTHASLDFIEARKVFDRREFFLHNDDEIRLEFVHYNFPKLGEQKAWRGIQVDSLEDIAANKTMALFDRNEPKDIIDLYFILQQEGYTADKLVKLAEKKFGFEVNEGLIWGEAMKGLEAIDELKPLLKGSVDEKKRTMQEIKLYFQDRSQEFIGGYLKE